MTFWLPLEVQDGSWEFFRLCFAKEVMNLCRFENISAGSFIFKIRECSKSLVDGGWKVDGRMDEVVAVVAVVE